MSKRAILTRVTVAVLVSVALSAPATAAAAGTADGGPVLASADDGDDDDDDDEDDDDESRWGIDVEVEEKPDDDSHCPETGPRAGDCRRAPPGHDVDVDVDTPATDETGIPGSNPGPSQPPMVGSFTRYTVQSLID